MSRYVSVPDRIGPVQTDAREKRGTGEEEEREGRKERKGSLLFHACGTTGVDYAVGRS